MSYNDQQYTNFSLAYNEAGYWREAEELQRQVMEIRGRALGEEHLDTLNSMASLEAEKLEVQVMHTRKRILVRSTLTS